jgi:hypothetical protein
LNFIKIKLQEVNIEELKIQKKEKNETCETLKKSLKEKENELKEINEKLIKIK